MERNMKLGQLPAHQDTPDIVANWMFSLLPIGVAFVFYVAFISATNIENFEVYIAYGAAAAFIALETYWIMYGLFKKHTGAIIMGLAGIFVTLGLLYLGQSL